MVGFGPMAQRLKFEQQERLDFEALVQEAIDGAYIERIRTEF